MGESHMFWKIDTVSTFYNRKMYNHLNAESLFLLTCIRVLRYIYHD